MSQLFYIWSSCPSSVHVLGIGKSRNVVYVLEVNSFEEKIHSTEKITWELFEREK